LILLANVIVYSVRMGVDHGGTRPPPEFGAGGKLMQIAPPPRFCHIGTKMSVCGLENTPKYVIGRGSARDPAGGAHDAPPDPLVGWKGDTSPHTPPHSARTHLRRSPCVPPEVQPDLRLCLSGSVYQENCDNAKKPTKCYGVCWSRFTARAQRCGNISYQPSL